MVTENRADSSKLKELNFGEKFGFGVATASTQIEGGFSNSNWNDWYNKGMIKDGSNPERANQHYVKFREDIDLMAAMNIKFYRMSVEWSRLEPEQGVFSEKEFEHYRQELSYLKENGISVLLTLHHFNNPMWFEKLGGFLSDDSPKIFENFVNAVIQRLGSFAHEYVTVNEPNVYASSAYYFGEFPPGKKSVKLARKCMTNLAAAHILAYNAIKSAREKMGYTDTRVGYASHMRVFEPKRKHWIVDIIGAHLMEKMFQTAINDACMLGSQSFPIRKNKYIKKGRYYDFIGINYYSRSLVKNFDECAKEDAPHNDMGWEIYPVGIKTVCENCAKKYNAPIYITENGTADRHDAIRARYIYDHLLQLSEAEADVERYYHWSFIDNFEWMDGEAQCFGLVELNYDTQKRTVRKSGQMYAEIAKENKITRGIINKYLCD